MLGEVIGESRGKRTVRQILPGDSVKVQVSFEDSGKLLGADVNGIGTYWAGPRPDGSLYGEGQGVMFGPGGELLSWRGAGVGKLGAGGAVSYRGAIYFWTDSPKFARLNAAASVFEFETDPQGNTHSKLWEWK
jgi:hypothetical protein